MSKDYTRWHEEKARINDLNSTTLFHEREIWWCSLGKNVGYEQDGDKDFVRPVLILMKYNLDLCLIIPLTTSPKTGKYYFPIGPINNRDTVAILSQIRTIDRKRLVNKIGQLNEETFHSLIRAVVEMNFPYKSTLPALAGGEQAEAVVVAPTEYTQEPDLESSESL